MGEPRGGWRYIVIRHTRRVLGKTEHYHGIHEAFHFDKNDIPKLWTEDVMKAEAENLDGLRWALAMMLADSSRMPVYEQRGKKLIKRSTPKS